MTGRAPTRQAARRGMCRHLRVTFTVALMAVSASIFLAAGAAGQYTVLGGAPASVPDEDALRRNVEDARWSAGPFKIQPWFGLRDVSYVRNQQSLSGTTEETDDQLTITAGAGIRAYAPVGTKTVWAAHVLPEYVWWQDNDSKDGVNGRYGMGLFTYANRVQVQLSHRLEEQQNFFSSEIQELTTISTATSGFGTKVEVLRGVHLVGGWTRTDYEGDREDDVVFSLLDRVEDGWHAGIQVRSRRGWSVGVGFQQSDGEFEDGARNLSYESEGVTFDLQAAVRRFSLDLQVEQAEVTPKPGSELEPVDETLGTVRLGFEPPGRIGWELYGDRQRSFSVLSTRSLIVTQEQGVRVFFDLGSWNLRLLGGTGSLETEGIGGAADQTDDYDVVGVSVGFTAANYGTLQVNALQRRYDVGLLGSDRDVTTLGLSIQLGELADRLSVGESRGVW